MKVTHFNCPRGIGKTTWCKRKIDMSLNNKYVVYVGHTKHVADRFWQRLRAISDPETLFLNRESDLTTMQPFKLRCLPMNKVRSVAYTEEDQPDLIIFDDPYIDTITEADREEVEVILEEAKKWIKPEGDLIIIYTDLDDQHK